MPSGALTSSLRHWPLLLAGFVILICTVHYPAAQSLAPWAFALGFILLGMPHGVYDVVLLTRHRRRFTQSPITLAAFYLLGIALVALLWWLSPGWTLVGFFLLTAIHWGTMDTHAPPHPTPLHLLDGHARGLMVISSIFAFHSQEALDELAPLTLPGVIPWTHVTPFLVIFFLTLVIQFAAITVSSRKSKVCFKHRFIELTVVAVMLTKAPVLLGIATYYLCFHSRRHFQRLHVLDARAFSTAHKFCLATVLPVIMAALLIHPIHEVIEFIHGSFPIHLTALALLTLPHAILSHRVRELVHPSCPALQS